MNMLLDQLDQLTLSISIAQYIAIVGAYFLLLFLVSHEKLAKFRFFKWLLNILSVLAYVIIACILAILMYRKDYSNLIIISLLVIGKYFNYITTSVDTFVNRLTDYFTR